MKKLFTFAIAAMAMFMGTTTVSAQNELVFGDVKVGEKITLSDGSEWLVGSNIVKNPSFTKDPSKTNGEIEGWLNGQRNPLSTNTFIWHNEGGYDGGPYIQANSHTGVAGAGSIATYWELEQGARYYFSFWLAKNSDLNQYIPVVSLTDREPTTSPGDTEDKILIGMNGDKNDDILGYGAYNGGDWAQTACSFETEEFRYLQFNARWLKENAIQACFDGFLLARLYRLDEITPEELIRIDVDAKRQDYWDDLYQRLNDLGAYMIVDGDGTRESLTEILEEDIDDMTVEELEAYRDKLMAAAEDAELAAALIPQLDALIDRAWDLLGLEYPGAADLSAVVTEADDFRGDGYGWSDAVQAIIDKLQAAIDLYLTSQEVGEGGADYTFFVKSPYFTKAGFEPTISYAADGSIEYISYDNRSAEYVGGSAPVDGSSEGWYIGTSGGDQRLNWRAGRICWNAWRTGDWTITINQDITGLPNGYYTISAEMLTQPNCVTDQHLFARSSAQETVSPALTEGNMYDENAEDIDWTYLTTEKVYVNDGKLTIGASGAQMKEEDGTLITPAGFSDTRGGWFFVTNFRLLYWGNEGAEDVLQTLYAEKLAEANAKVNEVVFALDKAALQAAITEATGATTTEEINAALAVLNAALTEAQASIDKYNGVITGSYATLKAGKTSDGDEYTTNQKAVANKAVEIMDGYINAANATYTHMDSLTTILREYYLGAYLPALRNAEEVTVTDALAKEALQSTINGQVAKLTAITAFPTKETFDKYIADLNKAISVVTMADLLASGDDDLTAAIVNGDFGATTDNNVIPTGWTVERENGNTYTAYGQGAVGDMDNNRYLDSWNGTAGLLKYTAYQTIVNIPNGVYEVKAITRASGTPGAEGLYLLGIDGTEMENAIFAAAHIKPTPAYLIDETVTDMDSVEYKTDTHGELWVEAKLGPNPDDNDYALVNGGLGRGWFYTSYQIEVTGNVLTLGITNDFKYTEGRKDTDGADCVESTNTWFSADNFTLKMIENKQPGYNPATGINAVSNETAAPAFFSLDGRRLNSLNNAPAGIYIIRQNGQTHKVLVK